MASIQQRGDTFVVVYDIGRDPVTLDRRRRSRTFRSEAEAEAFRDDVEGELEDGTHAAGGRLTVQGFYAGWVETLHIEVEPGTERAYREKMKYILDVVGRRRMTSITGDDLNAVYAGLLKRGLSGQSALHTHTVAYRFFGDAVKAGVISKNPVKDARRPKADDYLFATWTAADIRRFMESLPEDRWRHVWVMAITFGVRRGELLGASWDSLRGHRLFINQTVNEQGTILPKPKRSASRRWISLDPATMAAVDAMRSIVEEEKAFFGDSYQDHGLIVCWEDGRPIRGDLFSKWFRKKRRALGLPDIRLHDLRHTWATTALEAGVPAKVVQERLGHKSIAVTLNTYTKVTDPVADEAAQKVAEAMGF